MEVERLLCCCDYRVIWRCAAHPPRVGGPTTKLDPGGSGQEFTGRFARPGELGQGGDSAFRPREARERQQIRASGKAFVRSTKSSCALHGFASDVCWRVSRGTPLPSPGQTHPTQSHCARLCGVPGVFLSFVGTNSSPLSHHIPACPGGPQRPPGQTAPQGPPAPQPDRAARSKHPRQALPPPFSKPPGLCYNKKNHPC